MEENKIIDTFRANVVDVLRRHPEELPKIIETMMKALGLYLRGETRATTGYSFTTYSVEIETGWK